MTEPKNASPPGTRRRRWLRRAAVGLLVLVSLLIVSHRPLLIFTAHTVAVRLAAREGVRLSLDVVGSVLTEVTLKNIHAIPIGRSPVDSIDIESVQVQYDLVRLVRRGVRDFISGYRLRNAKLVLSPEHGTETQKEVIAKVLRDILQQPALFSDRVQVENLNLTINTARGAYIIGGAHALLDPVVPGYIRLEELTLPEIGSWREVRAAASFVDRHLIARDFHLGGDLHAVRLELDASQRAKGINYLSFEGTVLGGDIGLFLWRQEVGRSASDAQLTAYIGELPLKRLHDFFHWKTELAGTVGQAWVQLSGNPNIPSKWEGNIGIEAGATVVHGFRIDQMTGNLRFSNGKAWLEKGFITLGGSRVGIRTERSLPDSAVELLADGLETQLDVDVPDLAKVHPLFFKGTVKGTGRCRINSEEVSLVVSSTVAGVTGALRNADPKNAQLAAFRYSADNGAVEFRGSCDFRHRPPGTPALDRVRASLTTRMNMLQLGPCVFDFGKTGARLQQCRIRRSLAPAFISKPQR